MDDATNRQKKNVIDGEESTSIENQRLLLSKFCMISGWIETKVYCDDGYSGGNFNRPAFKHMIEDIQNGVINLVLVKDLSRLGRDYIEVGRYTDVLFPQWGCRFVSLLDDLDTDNEDNDMMHFRSLMNDYHLKDLSNKIKAVLHAKARAGQFITGQPVYGYTRSDDNKHQFLVDDYAAEVVKRVFEMRVSGLGYQKIANVLNNKGILAPLAYRRQNNGKPINNPVPWLAESIKGLIQNEAYIGSIVVRRRENISYKTKQSVNRPESEWVRHKNVHEPIIDMATWDKACKLSIATKEKAKKHSKSQPSLFMKKLNCMDCGSPMVSHPIWSKRVGKPSERIGTTYSCTNRVVRGKGSCTWHTITEKALTALILTELRGYTDGIQLDKNALLDRLKRAMSLDDTEQHNLLRQEVKRLQRSLDETVRITAELYEDKVVGKINESTYITLMSKNEIERQKRQAQFDEASARIADIENKILSVSKWAEVLKKHIHIENLCRADIEELIDRIEVGESDYSSGKRVQDVKIYWRFIGHIPH